MQWTWSQCRTLLRTSEIGMWECWVLWSLRSGSFEHHPGCWGGHEVLMVMVLSLSNLTQSKLVVCLSVFYFCVVQVPIILSTPCPLPEVGDVDHLRTGCRCWPPGPDDGGGGGAHLEGVGGRGGGLLPLDLAVAWQQLQTSLNLWYVDIGFVLSGRQFIKV